MSISPPPYRDKDLTGQAWQKWFASITDALKTTVGTLTSWASIDKTGSNLNELTTRNHGDLQGLNTPSYTHLTGAQYQSLTGGGNTDLHSHDMSAIVSVVPGKDGEDGIDGTNGIDGIDGRDGLDGFNGQDGENGEDGFSIVGPQGIAGKDGLTIPGQDGEDGESFYISPSNNHNALEDALINKLGTCLVTGCTLSINANPALFDISPGVLRFTDNVTNPLWAQFTEITYPGSTGNVVTNLATQDSTYVSIDIGSVIYQTATKPVAGDTRDKVLIGALVHTSHTSISSADSNTNVIGFDIPNCISDISYSIGPINEGNLYSGNVTNTLRIDKSAGYIWQIGINWKNDKKNPNRITAPASTGATHLATWRNGTGGWTTLPKTDIIPDRYDDGTGGATTPSGVLATNKWQAIKIFYLPNSALTGLEYGQVIYNSEAEAEAAKGDPTTDNPSLAAVPFRGWLLVRGGATDLNDPGDATFIDAGRFGQTNSGAGTGSSTTTLQDAYNNSTQPQITTDAIAGAFQIKRGSAADTDVVFEVLNGAGTPVFQVTGLGVSGTGITLAQARAVATLRI